MRLRHILALVGLVAGSTTIATATMSPAVATLPDVTVTVIDSGVRVTHQEFDYVSKTDTTDQVVAWWDFSDETFPRHYPWPGATWDNWSNGGEPFDNSGHGTAAASAAVGLNAAGPSTKRPSLCPGCKLAVAKVESDEDVVAAFKWAREEVKTNVITMSIGSLVPIPSQLTPSIYREIRLARQAGILVVLANGNGWANLPSPGQPGFAKAYANSEYALGVGAGVRNAITSDSFTTTTDPEVVSDSSAVPLASRTCDTCYAPVSGTSFSTPIVAGFAARLIQENPAMTPDYLEKLIKYSAADTLIPVMFEGYGVVDGASAQLSSAIAHAAAGTLPARPVPDFNGWYVETVQGALDDLWTDKTNEGSQVMIDAGFGTSSPAGTIGLSAPTGLSDAEIYKITATRGDVVTVDLGYAAPDLVDDVDLYVLRVDPASTSTMPDGGQMVAYSTKGGGVNESVRFVAPTTGEYYVVALGNLVVLPQAVTITSNTPLTPAFDGYVLHTFATGNPYLVEKVTTLSLNDPIGWVLGLLG